MTKFLLTILAASLVALGVYTTSPAETQFRSDQRYARAAYKAACSITQYRCKGKAPQVRRTSEIKKIGARGVYFGGEIVFILETLRDEQARLTIFHEIVHVLQSRSIPLDFKHYLQKCVLEREAMEYTNTYAKQLELADNMIRTLDEWRKLYGCRP